MSAGPVPPTATGRLLERAVRAPGRPVRRATTSGKLSPCRSCSSSATGRPPSEPTTTTGSPSSAGSRRRPRAMAGRVGPVGAPRGARRRDAEDPARHVRPPARLARPGVDGEGARHPVAALRRAAHRGRRDRRRGAARRGTHGSGPPPSCRPARGVARRRPAGVVRHRGTDLDRRERRRRVRRPAAGAGRAARDPRGPRRGGGGSSGPARRRLVRRPSSTAPLPGAGRSLPPRSGAGGRSPAT